MDISNIVANSRTIDILHPATGAPTGLKITLLPRTDEKVERAQRAILNRRLSSRKANVTAEQVEAEGIELLIAGIEDWEWGGDAKFEGDKPEFTPEIARKVLNTAKWIKAQIDREAGYEEAFFTS